MPNHIKNIVINSSELNIQKYSTLNEEGENEFDFEKVLPMPEILHKITAPATLCETSEEMEASKDEGGQYRKISKDFSFNLFATHGANNWHDWSVENWGTKWNAYHHESTEPLIFDTAWAIPHGVYKELARLEKTEIQVIWKDEGSSGIFLTIFDANGEYSEEEIATLEYVDEDGESDETKLTISEDYKNFENILETHFNFN